MKRNLLVIQDMVIGALTEGAEDQKHRQEAEKSADVLIQAAKAGSIKPKFAQVKGSQRATYDLAKLPGNEGLVLIVTVSPTGKEGFYFGVLDGAERIHIRIVDREKKYTGSPENVKNFKRWATEQIGPFLAAHRSDLVHEYVHRQDKARVKAPWKDVAGADPNDPKKYYNDPLETNAFSQMGMSAFGQKLKNVRTKDGALMLMGKSPQEFWKRLEKAMNPNFMAHLSDANKRKLQKRSYQLWQDTMAKFEERT